MNQQLTVPTDLADLALAPVALAVSRRLEQLGRLSRGELDLAIAAGTDHDPVVGRRAELLMALVARDLDLHHWSLAWCPSGLRLQHEGHVLVLGLAPGLRDFLDPDDTRQIADRRDVVL